MFLFVKYLSARKNYTIFLLEITPTPPFYHFKHHLSRNFPWQPSAFQISLRELNDKQKTKTRRAELQLGVRKKKEYR